MALYKTPAQIEIMVEAGRRLAEILARLKTEIAPGVTTSFLDERSRDLIQRAGAEPVFLGYRPVGSRRPYPAAICLSVNQAVVHGLPSDYHLRDGDVAKLDLGLRYRGWCVDAALTVAVGQVSQETRRFIKITEEALYRGIVKAAPGKTLGDIGAAIQEQVEGAGFSIVRSLTGHGIGEELHEEPSVFNFGRAHEGLRLEPGLVIAIEPITAMGRGAIRQLADDSYVTSDGSVAAHFEHTVAIMEDGPRILTKV